MTSCFRGPHFCRCSYIMCSKGIARSLPLQTSARWQPLSPGSLQNSTTSRHVVSGVMGTSVAACSPSLRYTVSIIGIILAALAGQNQGCIGKLAHPLIFDGTTVKTPLLSSGLWLLQCDNQLGLSPLNVRDNALFQRLNLCYVTVKRHVANRSSCQPAS